MRHCIGRPVRRVTQRADQLHGKGFGLAGHGLIEGCQLKADDWQAAACRRARAYKALQPILTAAMQQSDRVESQLADFLKTAPKLAKRLAHWQSEA